MIVEDQQGASLMKIVMILENVAAVLDHHRVHPKLLTGSHGFLDGHFPLNHEYSDSRMIARFFFWGGNTFYTPEV